MLALLALVLAGLVWWPLGADAPARPVTAAPGHAPGLADGSAGAFAARERAARVGAAVDRQPASLAGHVRRRADGRAVDGAVVAITGRSHGSSSGPGQRYEDALIVITDATGAWSAPSMPPGAYVVTASVADLLPARVDVALVAGTARTGVELLLEAGGTPVSGMVSDIGGGGIAGAQVRFSPAELGGRDDDPGYVTVTGDDGRYRLRLADGSWRGSATHAEYTAATHSIVLAEHPVTLDFTLTPGAVIRGQVLARDTREPVAGAKVIARGGHRGGARHRRDYEGATVTAADGTFTLRGVASGTVSLEATARGHASGGPTVVELGIGEELDGVELLVERAYTVAGFVVRAGAPGEGVPGVEVSVGSQGGTQTAVAPSSGADGYFEITGLAPGSYMTSMTGGGAMPTRGEIIEVVDHDVTDVILTVDAGVTLRGRVEPGAVATLALEVPASLVRFGYLGWAASLVRGDSDATGAFTLSNVPPGAFTLVAEARDGRVGTLRVVVSTTDQAGLVVPLEARGAIAGRVVDATGAAVAGVNVTATSGARRTTWWPPEADAHPTVTAPDGSFRIGGLEAGGFALVVEDEQVPLGWADPAAHAPAQVTLAAAEERRGVTLRVEARAGLIRGLVLDPDGNPARDAWVTALNSDLGADPSGTDRGTTVLCDDDGRFAITQLRRGTYFLVAEATRGGGRAHQPGVTLGATVTLRLERAGALVGTVTLDGTPLTAYELTCRGRGGERYRRRVSAADGGYRLDHLPPYTYACEVVADAGAAQGTTEVGATQTRLDLALVRWASVVGGVVDAAGAPRPGLRVVAGSDGSVMGAAMSGGGIVTDAAGRFEIGRINAGAGRVSVYAAGPGHKPLATRALTFVAGRRFDLGQITAPAGPP